MPRPEVIKNALHEIRKRAVNYEYFFNELKSPDWIEPLLSEGMFQHPPPLKLEGDYISFPFWPESRYLARMAPLASELVLKVALKIPETENIRVHADLADAASAMPPEFAAIWAKKEASWVKSHQYLYLPLPEKLGKLISYLARAGQVKEALNLASALLAVMPDSRMLEKFEEDEIYLLPPEPRTRFDIWHYEQVLKKHMPDLVATAGESALVLLSDLLSDAIRFSRRHNEVEGQEDYSYIWRPAIEDHNQNQPYGLKDLLVTAVRDAAEAMIETEGKVILEIIERRPFQIFQRIGLYLRRKCHNVDSVGTASLVSDPNVFNDIHLHHEFYYILHEQFNDLPPKAQQAYLSMIEQGVDTEKWLDYRERESGHRPSQQEGKRYVRRWQYTKLWPIQAFLKPEWQQRFDALKEEFGELDHPDFHVYTSTGWVGPTSPKGVQELRSMKMDELITFLKTWKPSRDFMSPSPQGIGRELTNLITSEPAHFATEANRFEGLDPTYVHALLSGFRTAKREDDFPWTPVLDLCRWVIDQPREITEHKDEDTDSDPNWIWTRRAIADLLSVALEPSAAVISFDHRTEVWDVLKPLTDDPDPTLEHEERYGGSNMDPATLSVNTVRGEAMHAVVRYALWVRRHIEKAADGKTRISRGFDEMPEVREVLDKHLDPNYDPALAIRAVYGQWFPWLVLLDPVWTAQRIVKIFPPEEALSTLRDAAWDAYVTFCTPYDNAFDLLREEYGRAVERIGTISSERHHLADPDIRLAEHLMTYYWRNKLNLNESGGLLARFYAKADGMLRGRSLEFIGRSLQNTTETVAPNILERLHALWAQRIEEVRNSSPPASHTELAAFGWWFISMKFDDDWAIAQLRDVLKLTGSIEPDYMVIERLATLASSMPILTIECLSFMIKGDEEGWGIHSWSEHARKILATALQSTDITARQAAEDLIHRLGACGYLAFRELLSEKK